MYTYDEVIASGYYVFRQELSSVLISCFFGVLKKLDRSLDKNNLRLKNLREFIEFDTYNYKLKEGARLEDIYPFVNYELVVLFECLKQDRDNYYESKCSSYKVLKLKK